MSIIITIIIIILMTIIAIIIAIIFMIIIIPIIIITWYNKNLISILSLVIDLLLVQDLLRDYHY